MRLDQRKLDEGSALAVWLVEEATARGDQLVTIIGRLLRVEANLYKCAIAAAESEILAIREIAEEEPYWGLWYLATLAYLRLAQGRAGEAAEIAERAYSRSRACGLGYCTRHAMLLLVRAEAFHALGNRDAACAAIREARDDLLRRAAKIPDSEPEIRRCFLENFPDHRRTLELAHQWLEEDGDAAGR